MNEFGLIINLTSPSSLALRIRQPFIEVFFLFDLKVITKDFKFKTQFYLNHKKEKTKSKGKQKKLDQPYHR